MLDCALAGRVSERKEEEADVSSCYANIFLCLIGISRPTNENVCCLANPNFDHSPKLPNSTPLNQKTAHCEMKVTRLN